MVSLVSKKLIHVNQNNIQKCFREKTNKYPVFEIGEITDPGVWEGCEAKEITITGKIRLVHDFVRVHPKGPRVWIEVDPGSTIKFN